jgi:hypothetical protein
MRAREFEEQGLTPAEALLAARRSFGDVAEVTDACVRERGAKARRMRVRQTARGVADDARVAIRMLARTPAFTLAAVLSLAAGIALGAATCALLDAYLLRALPYPDQDRLVSIEGRGSPDWRDPPAVLEQAVAWDLDAFSIVTDGDPERVPASWVTPSFFRALGVRPALGRLFTEDEAGPGGRAVAVISHGLRQRRWGGDPDVIGRTFSAYADDRPNEAEVFTIVGVLPADFWYFNRFTEVLAPLRGPRTVSLAVLAPGVTPATAKTVLERDARERDPAGEVELRVVHVREPIIERVRPTLLAVGGAVALVLLIACGNAAVLFLGRATQRERVFAIRAAIGAGRARLARHLVVEAVLVAALGRRQRARRARSLGESRERSLAASR